MTTQSNITTTPHCEHAQEIILATLERDILPETEQQFLQTHLATCTDCVGYQQTMSHFGLSLEALPELPIPAHLTDRIMNRIDRVYGTQLNNVVMFSPETKNKKAVSRTSTWQKYSAIAAAVTLLLISIPIITEQFSPQPTQPELAQQHPLPIETKTPTTTTPKTDTEIASLDEALSLDDLQPAAIPTTQAIIPDEELAMALGVEPLNNQGNLEMASASTGENTEHTNNYVDPIQELVGF